MPEALSGVRVVDFNRMYAGPLKMPGSVFKLTATPGNPLMPAPLPGEHNGEIYSGLLGCSENKSEELMAREII